MSGTEKNRRTDREQYTRSNAATARTRLTEHKRATRNSDVNNYIAERNLQAKHQIDWDSTYSTNYYQRLTLELVYHLRTNAAESKSTVTGTESTTNWRTQAKLTSRMTGQPTILLTINDCSTVAVDGSKRSNDIILWPRSYWNYLIMKILKWDRSEINVKIGPEIGSR